MGCPECGAAWEQKRLENLERWYQSEQDHTRRLTRRVGVQWGVRWPDGKIIACGDKGGAEYGVADHAGVMPGGVLIRRVVGAWEVVPSSPEYAPDDYWCTVCDRGAEACMHPIEGADRG